MADLARDAELRTQVASQIHNRSSLIWEDRHVVFEWARLLARLAGAETAVEPRDVGCDAHCLARGQR